MNPVSEHSICHVTSVHTWEDIRIFKKEATSTAKYFDKVILIAPNPPDKKVNGVYVTGVNIPSGVNRIIRILKYRRSITKHALKQNADLYHLHDPELLPFVYKLKRKGKKVVFDSHEDTPKTIITKQWIKPSILRKWITSVYNWYEKRTVKKCDGLISVLPGITEKFECSQKETIFNYPLISEQEKKITGGKFKIIYNGGLTRIRGIKELCQAMNYLESDFQLQLLGRWESEAFKNECLNEINDLDRLEDLGLVDFDTCQKYLSQADVGIVLFQKVPNHNYSLPNKSFEFTLNNLPMVMSNIPFWIEEFKDNASYADPEKPEEVAQQIMKIKKDYSTYSEKAQSLKSIIVADKNWNSQEKKLIDFYKAILNQ